jgi:hypothetical protein
MRLTLTPENLPPVEGYNVIAGWKTWQPHLSEALKERKRVPDVLGGKRDRIDPV